MLLMALGILWTGLTFATCSVLHGDPVPGAADFDPDRNTVLVLYSLVSINGVSSRTATVVTFGLMTTGAALMLAGIILQVRRSHRG